MSNVITESDQHQRAQKALDKAKIQLMSRKDSAFFTTVCFSLRHVWDEGIPTACTNGTEIRFNPTFFLKLDWEEQVFLVLHETLHVAYMHMLRLKERDATRWNYAADYVINYQLVERGFKMPQGGLHDPQYADMSTEQVYDLLPEQPEDESLMDLVPGDGEAGEGDAELEQTLADILVRASVQSRMQGDAPGSIPGELEVYINGLLNPNLPWHVILRRFINELAKNDYSWRKPNRRFFPRHYLPSLYSETLEHIAVAVDASGSVTDEEFTRFVSEVHGILRSHRPKQLTLVTFDTHIRAVDTVKNTRDLKNVVFKGRGGTRIDPVMEWARLNRPNALLVFSDGHFHAADIDPRLPIVWLIHENPTFTAEFGRVIHYEV